MDEILQKLRELSQRVESLEALTRRSEGTKGEERQAGAKQELTRRSEGTKGEERQAGAKQEGRSRARPNYFIGIPVSTPKLTECLDNAKQVIAEVAPHLSESCVDPPLSHITLAVLNLGDEDVEKAADALLSFHAKHAPGSMTLKLDGIGNFRQEVVFVQTGDSEDKRKLTQLAEALQTWFVEADLLAARDVVTAARWTAHVTIAKMSKMRRRGTPRRFPAQVMTALNQLPCDDLGNIDLTKMQLCRMTGRAHGEYYPVVAEVPLGAGQPMGYHRPPEVTASGVQAKAPLETKEPPRDMEHQAQAARAV